MFFFAALALSGLVTALCNNRTCANQNLIQVEVPIEADEGVLTDAPLVFCYGHTEVMHNSDVYLAQVDRCARIPPGT